MTNLKTSLATLGLAASLSLASSIVSAGSFTVDETNLTSGTNSNIVADLINGRYLETITFGPLMPVSLTEANLSFDTTAVADFNAFINQPNPFAVTSDLNVEYDIYAVFTSQGVATINPSDPAAPPSFVGNTGSVELYLDVANDTSTDIALNLSNTGDDLLLGSTSSLTNGQGTFFTPITLGGAFDLMFDGFSLTADGSNFFVEPDPFYIKAIVDGDFDTFVVAPNTTALTSGDVSVVFVPEPATVALMGASLIGFGAIRRKK